MTELYNPEFLFLAQEDVITAGVLDMNATLDDVELAYRLFASGEINQPHKSVTQYANEETGLKRQYLTVSMPVYVGGEINRAGIKWAAESMDNAARGDMPMGVDIITTQTTARKNIVEKEWIPKGSYYAHMAADETEDEVFLETDLLVTDNWQTLKDWDFFPPARLVNEGRLNADEIVDLGEIIIGEKEGRKSPEDNILFANLGMGCLDIVIAERIYNNTKEQSLGQKLSLWEKPLWI